AALPGPHHGRTRGAARLTVERDVADRDRAAGLGARLDEGVLHPAAREAVGEVADGLVVVERGLADPALGAGAADDEAAGLLGVRLDREARVVDGGRAQHDARGLRGRLGLAVRPDPLAHRERELPQA